MLKQGSSGSKQIICLSTRAIPEEVSNPYYNPKKTPGKNVAINENGDVELEPELVASADLPLNHADTTSSIDYVGNLELEDSYYPIQSSDFEDDPFYHEDVGNHVTTGRARKLRRRARE